MLWQYDALQYWKIKKICKQGSYNKQDQDQKTNNIKNCLSDNIIPSIWKKFETFMKKAYCLRLASKI